MDCCWYFRVKCNVVLSFKLSYSVKTLRELVYQVFLVCYRLVDLGIILWTLVDFTVELN